MVFLTTVRQAPFRLIRVWLLLCSRKPDRLARQKLEIKTEQISWWQSAGYLGSLLNSSADTKISLGSGRFHLEGETTVADAETLFIEGGSGSLVGSGALKAAYLKFDAEATD